MKIGTKILAYYLPNSEDKTEDVPMIKDIMHGIVVDGENSEFKDVEWADGVGEKILVRFPCKTHPNNKTCNCENNVRSMRRAKHDAPHLYEENYYGGYYGQVIIVPEDK